MIYRPCTDLIQRSSIGKSMRDGDESRYVSHTLCFSEIWSILLRTRFKLSPRDDVVVVAVCLLFVACAFL